MGAPFRTQEARDNQLATEKPATSLTMAFHSQQISVLQIHQILIQIHNFWWILIQIEV
jgi:hypothetical protein